MVNGALTLAVIGPIPMPNRYVSDFVIDCNCVVVKPVRGCVDESLHAATKRTAPIAVHRIDFFFDIVSGLE